MRNKQSGLTLLELLLALTILASLFVAIGAYTTHAAALHERTFSKSKFERATIALLDAMALDLTVGDFIADAQRVKSRVLLQENSLSIETRAHGPETHRYRYDAIRKCILLQIERREEVALGEVAALQITQDQKRAELNILITGEDGSRFERSVLLP